MLTALLPSSKAPISRSRLSSRRLTIPALGLPFFSSRSMRARENAISAVSLPAKTNESARQATIATIESQSSEVIELLCLGASSYPKTAPRCPGSCSGQGVGEKAANLRRIDVIGDEGLADPAR